MAGFSSCEPGRNSIIAAMTDFHLRSAAEVIRNGGLVAYPTEAVYGLGCDPRNERAVERLLRLKGRSVKQGLILLAADVEQLRDWMDLDEMQRAWLASQWPSARTWLVSPSARVPRWITGEHERVAVRVSAHPVARTLARYAGTPIVSTSANRSGEPAARNRFQVGRRLGAGVDFIVTGECDPAARPSTIIDFESGRVVRE